jgi:hypothetical protein
MARQSRSTFDLPDQEPNEGSPLVVQTVDAVMNSEEEEEAYSTLENDNSSRAFESIHGGNNTNGIDSGRGWRTLQKRLAQGDLELNLKEHTNKKRLRSLDSIRGEAFKEFHSAINFPIQRCLIVIVGCIMISIPVFSFLLEPQWTIIDSSYFAATTFTTLGYGDLTPTSQVSRIFTAGYAVLGIITLGLALGSLGNQLIEKHQLATNRAEEISKNEIMNVFSTESSASVIAQATVDSSRNPSTSTGSTRSCSTTRASIFQKQTVDVSRLFILVVVMLVLAFWIGYESGWDVPDTIYYLIITGKDWIGHVCDPKKLYFLLLLESHPKCTYIFKNKAAQLAMATSLRPHKWVEC